MYKHLLVILLLSIVGISASCKDKNKPKPPAPPVPVDYLAKGGDVSWLPQMEATGFKFFESDGTETDCLVILKNRGMNTVRLRVFVHPSSHPQNGHCSKEETVAMAVRAKELGMRVMIDFHYSDTWADPGNQTKPAAWANCTFAALKDSVYQHTYDVLNALKSAGVTPTWVQIGNETNDGMLWEEGRASKNMGQFAAMVAAGAKAVRETSASSKVIVHISNGYDNALFRWIFDGLTANKVDYDIIAMSLYPSVSNWSSLNMQCLNNMNDMVARYNKEIMISEVGMEMAAATACKSFIQDLIAKTKSVNQKKGLGVFYWEPQSYNSWKGYKLGAFDDTGKPTVAMDAFIN